MVSHSSCEAEITAAHQGVVEAKLLTHLLTEQDEVQNAQTGSKINVMIYLSVDSTSTVGFTARRGPGALKHMDLKYLSLQDDVRDGLLRVSHVPTDILLADFLTKPCCEYKLTQFCHAVRLMPELTLESGYGAGGGMSAVAELREVHLVELGEEEEQPFEFDIKLWLMFLLRLWLLDALM